MTGIEFVKKYKNVLNIAKIEEESNLGKTTLYRAVKADKFSVSVTTSVNNWFRKKYK